MKSPEEIKSALRRQWENPSCREARLLGTTEEWPLVFNIGRLSQETILQDITGATRRFDAWRQVRTGQVVWKEVGYRFYPMDTPYSWTIRNPADWIEAIDDLAIRKEYQMIVYLMEQSDPMFHSMLIRKRSLWKGKPIQEVLEATKLATLLSPKCAQGRPLRTMAPKGMDTKFFERNSQLLTKLLDVRFDEEVSRIGLHNFLDAFREEDHWLLIVDLDGSILPFKKLRVRSSELRTEPLHCDRLIIVENESSQHQLPQIPSTIAILGAGFDLTWTDGEWLRSKKIAYWGDIDTWGLQFLARARRSFPDLVALSMTAEVYDQHPDCKVSEPVVASDDSPYGLTASEQELYQRLIKEPKGRLEQEFLREEFTQDTIKSWGTV
jgi:hypothetical protein